MKIKQIVDILRGKGVELTTDELISIQDSDDNTSTPATTTLPIDYSGLQHNVKAIEELKNFFTEKLAEKDNAIKELTAKLDAFTSESLEKEKQRAAQDEIYKKQQEAFAKEQNQKIIDDAVAKAIEVGKIAPLNEKLINTLKANPNIDEVNTYIEGLSIVANPAGNQTTNTNKDNTINDEFALLTSGINKNITAEVAKEFKQS